jgi:distribution and morphology protein 12
MSVDIQWNTLTGGSDGKILAEKVRNFIHERFQQVPLPRFIRSVKVHSFEFGDIPPVIEVKDICDPHPDFYEEEEEEEDDVAASNNDNLSKHKDKDSVPGFASPKQESPPIVVGGSHSHDVAQGHEHHQHQYHYNQRAPTIATNKEATDHHTSLKSNDGPLSPVLLGSGPNSGIPGGTSNMTYFHLPYGPGLSGSTTPLAAVAGGQFHNTWPENINQSTRLPEPPPRHHTTSISSLTPSLSDPASRPSSQHAHDAATLQFVEQLEQPRAQDTSNIHTLRSPNDLQIVSRVKYSGNMSLVLTTEILLDYPMPSFVEVPFQLHITGFSFDGVSILAYAANKVHFCFLSPEDARAFLGSETENISQNQNQHHPQFHAGGLLEEIHVESEIGQKDTGRQVLKNVGKVEKFVLEQVRRIFENEFVFPSFWTFVI